LNSGRIDDALKELHQASLHYPDDPEILLRQGDTYRKAANLQMQQVLTQSAGKPLLHQVYGDMYLDEQQWQKAEGHYDRALKENDHWPNAHYGLGQTYLQQHKLDAAQKEFSEELSINANSAASSSMLAKISLLRGNPHEATTYLAEAIAKSPAEAASALGLPPSSTSLISQDTSRADEDDKEKTQQNLSQSRSMIEASAPSAARSLALAFLDGLFGDKEGASKAWEEFQNLAPQPEQSNPYERARVAFDRKDFEAAEKDLTTLLQVNPSEVNARYPLARTYRNQSLSVMGKLLAVAPDSYPAHQLMGETYESADEDEKALAEYRQVEKLAPDLPGIHFSIGSLLLKMNHADEAFTELQAELRQDPDHAGTNAEIGSILLNRNQPDNAIAYLQKAVQADPDSSPAHRELGRAYYMKEQYKQAEMELRRSLNDDPEGASHYQLAMVYRALGRTDAAKQMLALVRQIKFERYNEDERSTAAVQGIQ